MFEDLPAIVRVLIGLGILLIVLAFFGVTAGSAGTAAGEMLGNVVSFFVNLLSGIFSALTGGASEGVG